jgi:hypothetical protein
MVACDIQTKEDAASFQKQKVLEAEVKAANTNANPFSKKEKIIKEDENSRLKMKIMASN